MKKGIQDVNGFISFTDDKSLLKKPPSSKELKEIQGVSNSTQKNADKRRKEPNMKSRTNTKPDIIKEYTRENSIRKSQDKTDVKDGKKDPKVVSNKAKASSHIARNSKNIQNDQNLKLTKPKYSSLAEDKRGTQTRRITMNDVYKTKVKDLESASGKLISLSNHTPSKIPRSANKSITAKTNHSSLLQKSNLMEESLSTNIDSSNIENVANQSKCTRTYSTTKDQNFIIQSYPVSPSNQSAISQISSILGNDTDSATGHFEGDIINKSLLDSAIVEKSDEPEYEYADDFEALYENKKVLPIERLHHFDDYESDFESYTDSLSSSSEKNCIGNLEEDTAAFQNAEEKKDTYSENDMSLKMPYNYSNNLMDMLKESMIKENETAMQFLKNGTQKSENIDVSNGLFNLQETNLRNFSSAKIREQRLKRKNKVIARGEKLLKMIKLDAVNYSLFEKSTIPYDVFMKSFARENTSQVCTQTNEDNLNEEIQTESMKVEAKWTQYPPSFTKVELNEANLSQLIHGVGGKDLPHTKPEINNTRLERFVRHAGQIIIVMIEEDIKIKNMDKNMCTDAKFDFSLSEGYVSLCTEESWYLKHRPVTRISYAPDSPFNLLTVHGTGSVDNTDELYDRFIICIWDTLAPSQPVNVLITSGVVTTCCFGSSSTLVLAGHDDGVICVWDLQEKSPHQFIELESKSDTDLFIRSPAYTTAELRNDGHTSTVMDIQAIQKDDVYVHSSTLVPITFCSIDEEGVLIVWVVRRSNEINTSDFGCAPWSRIRVFISHHMNIIQHVPKSMSVSLQISCMKVIAEHQVYIGINDGSLIHFPLYVQNKHAKISLSQNIKSCVTCIEACPTNKKLFIVGYSNGWIQLHKHPLIKPVWEFCISPAFPVCYIICIKWLWHCSDVVIILDSSCRIYLFNTGYNINPVPIYTKFFEYDVLTSIQLSPFTERYLSTTPYLALLSNNSQIQVHKLKMDLIQDKKDNVQDYQNQYEDFRVMH